MDRAANSGLYDPSLIPLRKKEEKNEKETGVGPYLKNHYARPFVCWISVKKEVLYEFHWLYQLRSISCQKCGNEGS